MLLQDDGNACGRRCLLEGVILVLAVLATQLETPRGRYDEHSSKFPSIVKPRFN
jgi:hypothetical protein